MVSNYDNMETKAWIESLPEGEAKEGMEKLQAEFLQGKYQGDLFRVSAEDLEKYREVSDTYLKDVPAERRSQPLASLAEQIQGMPAPEEQDEEKAA